MRVIPIIARGGLAALASLTVACNSLVGLPDVSPQTVDAGPRPDAPVDTPMCDVASSFSLISSNPSTSILTRTSTGAPNMLFLLNADAKPDALQVLLYSNLAGHGNLTTPGTYSLTAGDAKLETCGICAAVQTNFDNNATPKYSQTYFALTQGSLTINSATTTTRLVGRMQSLKFRRVNLSSSGTVDVNDGCLVTIGDVEFDMMYQTVTGSAEPARTMALDSLGR
jgi:hypothetical protein